MTRHKIAALLKCKKWAFTCIWLPLKAKGISYVSVQISVHVLKLKMYCIVYIGKHGLSKFMGPPLYSNNFRQIIQHPKILRG